MLRRSRAMVLAHLVFILTLGAAEDDSPASVSISEYSSGDSEMPVSYLRMCTCDGEENLKLHVDFSTSDRLLQKLCKL